MLWLLKKDAVPPPPKPDLPPLFRDRWQPPAYLRAANRRFLVRVERTEVVEIPVTAASENEAKQIAQASTHGAQLSFTTQVLAVKEGL